MKIERGAIVIDHYGRTNVPGVWAIGDVAGPPMLAHKAEHEAVITVETIAGLQSITLDKLQGARAAPIASRRSPASG